MKSSAAVYGSSPRDPAMFTEDMNPKTLPRTGFGKDSVEVEGYVRGFSRRRPDVEITMLRLANIVGPSIHTAMTDYFSLPVVPLPLGFDARFQFVHEDDATAAMILATTGPKAVGIVNVAGDGFITVTQCTAIARRPVFPVPLAGGRLPRQHRQAQRPRRLLGRPADLPRLRPRPRHDAYALGARFEPLYSTRAAFLDFATHVTAVLPGVGHRGERRAGCGRALPADARRARACSRTGRLMRPADQARESRHRPRRPPQRAKAERHGAETAEAGPGDETPQDAERRQGGRPRQEPRRRGGRFGAGAPTHPATRCAAGAARASGERRRRRGTPLIAVPTPTDAPGRRRGPTPRPPPTAGASPGATAPATQRRRPATRPRQRPRRTTGHRRRLLARVGASTGRSPRRAPRSPPPGSAAREGGPPARATAVPGCARADRHADAAAAQRRAAARPARGPRQSGPARRRG